MGRKPFPIARRVRITKAGGGKQIRTNRNVDDCVVRPLCTCRVRLCSPRTIYIQFSRHLDDQEAASVSGTSTKTTDLPSYDRPPGLIQTDILPGPSYMRSTKLLSFDLLPLPAFIRFSITHCAVRVHISTYSARTTENRNCVDH